MTDEIQSRINSYLRQISNRTSVIRDMQEQNRGDRRQIKALERLSKRLTKESTNDCNTSRI